MMDPVLVVESGGYDFDAVNETSKDLSCVICFKLMKNPVQFNCGHGMCATCYADLIESTRDKDTCCPQCREVVFDCQVMKNVMLHRFILALKVRCKNKDSGCEWTCELSDMQKHLDVCDYEKIKCKNGQCAIMVERRKMHHHLSECILKTMSDSSRIMQQLQWTISKQDKDIHSLRIKLRESNSKNVKLEQEFGRLRDKLERIEHSKFRNDKDAHEDMMNRITELTQRQTQMLYDLNSLKEDRCSTASGSGYLPHSTRSMLQRYSQENSTGTSGVISTCGNVNNNNNANVDIEFDYELGFSGHSGHSSGKEYNGNSSAGSSSSSNSSSASYLSPSYSELSPVAMQQQGSSSSTQNSKEKHSVDNFVFLGDKHDRSNMVTPNSNFVFW